MPHRVLYRPASTFGETAVAHMPAFDQGTTSSHAIVFDDRGMVVASAQREFAQHHPQPGWGEHDPETLWRSQSAVTVDALAPAIVWQDVTEIASRWRAERRFELDMVLARTAAIRTRWHEAVARGWIVA